MCNAEKSYPACEGHTISNPFIVQSIIEDGLNIDAFSLIGKRIDKPDLKGEIIGYEYGPGQSIIIEVLKDEACNSTTSL